MGSLEDRRLLAIAAPVHYAAGSSTQAVVTGDFNNDGLADLLLSKGQQLLLFTNRGTRFVEVRMPGFRPGKAPRGVLIKRIGEEEAHVVVHERTSAANGRGRSGG